MSPAATELGEARRAPDVEPRSDGPGASLWIAAHVEDEGSGSTYGLEHRINVPHGQRAEIHVTNDAGQQPVLREDGEPGQGFLVRVIDTVLTLPSAPRNATDAREPSLPRKDPYIRVGRVRRLGARDELDEHLVPAVEELGITVEVLDHRPEAHDRQHPQLTRRQLRVRIDGVIAPPGLREAFRPADGALRPLAVRR